MRSEQETWKKKDIGKRSVRRLILTTLASCLVLLVLFPWSSGFAPEGNPFAGPLWLLKTKSWGDFYLGCGLLCFLLPMIAAIGLRVNAFTIALCVVGVLLWVGVGILIAAGAAC